MELDDLTGRRVRIENDDNRSIIEATVTGLKRNISGGRVLVLREDGVHPQIWSVGIRLKGISWEQDKTIPVPVNIVLLDTPDLDGDRIQATDYKSAGRGTLFWL